VYRDHFAFHPSSCHYNIYHQGTQIYHFHVSYQTYTNHYNKNHQPIDVYPNHEFHLVAIVRYTLVCLEMLLFQYHVECIFCDRFLRCRFFRLGILLCFIFCFHRIRSRYHRLFLMILLAFCEVLVFLLLVLRISILHRTNNAIFY
jgi:hypothetical protein